MIVAMVFASIGIEGVGCVLAMARISLTQITKFARDRNAIAFFLSLTSHYVKKLQPLEIKHSTHSVTQSVWTVESHRYMLEERNIMLHVKNC
jgi:hypothetical protein